MQKKDRIFGEFERYVIDKHDRAENRITTLEEKMKQMESKKASRNTLWINIIGGVILIIISSFVTRIFFWQTLNCKVASLKFYAEEMVMIL